VAKTVIDDRMCWVSHSSGHSILAPASAEAIVKGGAPAC